ncbi:MULTISPECIES: TolC family protein [unclassified Fusibacter]|uniref:TolC family protein n=1 Tax=unclassified Fusibacter TaxID=2624464 RepID=UPI001011F374|nr:MULTISPECIES: TolC family protein [unclassified Fusibacter]MCK8061243.1 TolC family protein [Fusibacter sp. A2]NPE23413.1 TolC family protein [Fusibacter sp. A1]RXV59192.1 hypothetical protein DWB64_16480 [Fusibacter sp. A1]
MKRLFIGIISCALITSQLAFAQPILLSTAIDSSDSFVENELQANLDKFAIQSAVSTQNNIENLLSMYKKYNIRMDNSEELNFVILANTTLDKTLIGNEIKAMGYRLAENATYLGARNLSLAVLSAKQSTDLALLKLETSEAKLEAAQKKYELGLITNLDLQEEVLSNRMLVNELKEAQTTYADLNAKLTDLAGAEVIVVREEPISADLQPLEYYSKLSENRFEIKQLQKTNELLALDLPYYQLENYLYSKNVKEDYNDLQRTIELNHLKIESSGYQIENEIRDAYFDLQSSRNSLIALKAQLDSLRTRYAQMQNNYNLGLISSIMLKEFSQNVMQLENGYYLAAYDYNTKRLRLNYAVSIGPAY